MDKEIRTFKDPKGKFAIGVSSNWKYHKSKTNGLHQFEVSETCVFQISCRPINNHISEIIESNDIEFHDFDLPNISYHESYVEQENLHSYIWMCPLDDHFITSMYYYDPRVKPLKDVGLELMEIRLNLQNVHFFRRKEQIKKSTKKVKQTIDYNDILAWRNKPSKFMEFISNSDQGKVKMTSPVDIDVIKLYALLKSMISHKPNGFYDLVRIGLPLDNMIWWDYVLECDKGFIQIWRTPHVVEAMYLFDGDFDLEIFLKVNIKKYSQEISEAIKSFEHHTIYINHYKSYQECVETLWQEISKINLTPPRST